MPANEFLAFADTNDANVISQATYEQLLASGALKKGFESGIAYSARVNKVLRQTSAMVSALGGAMGSLTGQDILDNGDSDALTSNIIGAMASLGAQRLKTIGGTATAITGTATGLYSYTVGLTVSLVVAATNTGPTTLKINGLSAVAIQNAGAALKGSEMVIGQVVMLAYDGTVFQLMQPAAFLRNALGASLRSVLDKTGEQVSVKDFGAKGDGVTADQQAINNTIIYLNSLPNGGEAIIPDGDYLCTDQILMLSKVTVRCLSSGARINGNSFTAATIGFYGTASAEFALSVNAGVGSTSLTTATATGWSPGDLLHTVSVMNALSRVDAGEYWLGTGTGSLPYCYFAEFNFAQSVTTNVIQLATPLNFPGYNTTNAGQVLTNRTTSAVQKITPCRNAKWIGGTVIKDQVVTAFGSRIFDSLWAMECSVEDTITERGSVFGSAVAWQASFRCTASNVISHNDPTLVWNPATMHGHLNRFTTISCQDCGFRGVSDSFGAQSVDQTYADGISTSLFCNMRAFCEDSYFYHSFEGLTSHPGNYQEIFKNNRIFDCYLGGIQVRGYAPDIQGNIITGTVNTTTGSVSSTPYGISFAFGGPRRAFCSGNTVRNMYGGFVVYDSNELPDLDWLECGIDIADNTVSGCFVGLQTNFANSHNNSIRKLNYLRNTHSLIGRYVVNLDMYSAGCVVKGNILNGDFTFTGTGAISFVRTLENCPNLEATDNTWNRSKGGNSGYTKSMVSVNSVTDTTTYPAATWGCTSIFYNNNAHYGGVDGVLEQSIGSTNYRQERYSAGQQIISISSGGINLIPKKDGVSTLTVDTEAAAPSDDLDSIFPDNNIVLQTGMIVVIRCGSASRPVTIRDVSTSGASNGFDTPSSASILLDTSSDNVTAMWTGTVWVITSVSNSL